MKSSSESSLESASVDDKSESGSVWEPEDVRGTSEKIESSPPTLDEIEGLLEPESYEKLKGVVGVGATMVVMMLLLQLSCSVELRL